MPKYQIIRKSSSAKNSNIWVKVSKSLFSMNLLGSGPDRVQCPEEHREKFLQSVCLSVPPSVMSVPPSFCTSPRWGWLRLLGGWFSVLRGWLMLAQAD